MEKTEGKKEFTEAEMARIKASRAVMKVIEKQIERGDFDEYLDKEYSKVWANLFLICMFSSNIRI